MGFSWERCERFIDTVEPLGVDNPQAVLEAVTECGITAGDFIELDERPGQFPGGYRNTWHVALRRVRNDPGNDLFARLAANAPQPGRRKR